MSRLSFCSTLLSLSLTSVAVAATGAQTDASSLTVTTFNVKYFGTNGKPDSTEPESRVETIRAHLTKENLWTDVIVFEEIVDVDLLQDEVLGSSYRCRSYDHPNPDHQHVVVCHRREFSFVTASDDDNHIIEEVTLDEDRYRPVVHGILRNRAGQKLLHIMGAHFKAYPEFTAVRLQQTDIVANYIDARVDDVPVILLGDFNTYGSDTEQIGALLDHAAEGLAHVQVRGEYTWRSGSKGNKFDHIWLSRRMKATGTRVAGPCNSNDRASIAVYNETVSDHCPVTLTVSRARSHR